MNNKLFAGTRPPPSSSQPGDELPEHTAPVCQPLPCPRHTRWVRPFVNAETWNDRRTQNQPAASTASVGRTWLEGGGPKWEFRFANPEARKPELEVMQEGGRKEKWKELREAWIWVRALRQS